MDKRVGSPHESIGRAREKGSPSLLLQRPPSHLPPGAPATAPRGGVGEEADDNPRGGALVMPSVATVKAVASGESAQTPSSVEGREGRGLCGPHMIDATQWRF
uniref:DUF834 domain-containing protein n=1 Tax=Oryza nivara TaxID=4536 RepID=A0A0E0GCM1_ORYNI